MPYSLPWDYRFMKRLYHIFLAILISAPLLGQSTQYVIEQYTGKNYPEGDFVDMEGNVLYKKDVDNELVLNESYTYILNEMMTSTYNSSFIDYNTPTVMSVASKISNKYAIKTGSSGTDCWMVGYNSNLLMLVWNGYDDNSELEVKDGAISKNIWVDTVESLNIEKEWYTTPDNVVGIPLDAVTGEITDKAEKTTIFYYVNGSEYNNQDTEFVFKEKND